jgi:RNA polymerase sigma factor (sigma-70 family)
LRLRTDDTLVARFRLGYDDAFEVIDDRYRPALFAYTRQMLGWSNADAEDALQEVLLRAYSALRRDDRPVTLRAWLYRIANNYCIDQVRRPVPAPCELYDVSRPPNHDPVMEAEQHEKFARIVSDIQRLPEQQRSAILMSAVDGMRYAEIAAALEISEPAVKSVLNRARGSLHAAKEAREAACVDIRAELDRAHDRKVRMSGRSRKHLRDCAECAAYKQGLVRVTRTINSLGAPPGLLGLSAKLLGLGGAGSGMAASGGAAAGGGGAIAAKVTALVCCGAMFVGASEVKKNARDGRAAREPAAPAATASQHARHRQHRSSVLAHTDRTMPAAAAGVASRPHHPTVRFRRVASTGPADPSPALIPTKRAPIASHRAEPPASSTPTTYRDSSDAAHQTGGAAAPDDAATPANDPPARDQSTGAAAPSGDPESIAAPDQSAPAAPEVNAKPQTATPAPTTPEQTAATPAAPAATARTTPAPPAGGGGGASTAAASAPAAP